MIKVEQPVLLDVKGLKKSFAGVRALKDVSLDIRAGEVHCILGQNGAGKSTLIKTLAGVHQPDEGQILWMGDSVTIPDPQAAIELGIATMYQELDVVDGLTVAENIFLGHELSRGGFTRRGRAYKQARELMKRLGHSAISPRTEVGTLSAANKQIVSMARALSHDIKLIIMDEPSAVLDSEEVKNLFAVVRELTSAGIAVVYITHRLEEIRQIGDRITVIKDGRSMAHGLPVGDTPTSELIRLMTGRAVENVFPPAVPVPGGSPVVLDVEGLELEGVFSDVSFTVRAGEIVGLAGLVGSGRSEILETVYGARRSTGGRVSIAGAPLKRGSVIAAVKAGMGLSPEERKSQGLVLDEPIYVNVTLSSLPRFARAGWVDTRAERKAAAEQITALDLRPADPDRPAITLSGGNQQKILLARWLVHGTRVLLLDEPTRGVDVGARAEIYALIRRLAADGNAIVIVSSEIEEVLGLADTVLVVADGRVLDTLPASEIDEHGVLELVMKGAAA
ncbi:sugar ABC transporter ATP-binding protein [Microbacterium sp. SLBN-146]|uniref:sugar ABC transporter ATP-binding protein n=1 Tax=Microbacterium sp. SLBN-146 TaxID=2768457 RepID=UPI001172B050|nr:sugar ABC transporter ATP-binding protein [Microbacterium sp. SLBN-146]TQJ30709.1 monosaccharide ABC transporter ATP-binding protein (CUT2 family) [Microbacterium sp. SLBN-146]